MGSKRPRSDSPWSWRERGELLRRVRHAYGDLDHPRRDFVLTALRQEPYRQVIDELALLETTLIDDTDVNCDVCFRYIIGPVVLFLRLSMVGPYVILERAKANGEPDLISREKDCCSGLEESIYRVLVRHGLHLTSDAQLADDIEINLPGVGRSTVYTVLFSPEEESRF